MPRLKNAGVDEDPLKLGSQWEIKLLKVMVGGNYCLWFSRDCRVKVSMAEECLLLPGSQSLCGGDAVQRHALAWSPSVPPSSSSSSLGSCAYHTALASNPPLLGRGRAVWGVSLGVLSPVPTDACHDLRHGQAQPAWWFSEKTRWSCPPHRRLQPGVG